MIGTVTGSRFDEQDAELNRITLAQVAKTKVVIFQWKKGLTIHEYKQNLRQFTLLNLSKKKCFNNKQLLFTKMVVVFSALENWGYIYHSF